MRFSISDQALNDAKQLGVDRAKLAYAARFSTPFYHAAANRRFGDVLLLVENSIVTRVFPVNVMAIDSGKRLYICGDCDADGGMCMTCDSKGTVLEYISIATREGLKPAMEGNAHEKTRRTG
jgi:hypothetical protein